VAGITAVTVFGIDGPEVVLVIRRRPPVSWNAGSCDRPGVIAQRVRPVRES
jgi:hypothetical protein